MSLDDQHGAAERAGVAAEVHRFDLAPFITAEGRPVKDLNDLCLVPCPSLPTQGLFSEVIR